MIFADVYEPSDIIIGLEQIHGQVFRTHLDHGDYMFYAGTGKQIAVERKSPMDLVQSILTARLAKQLSGSSSAGMLPILLLEGLPMLASDGVSAKSATGSNPRYTLVSNALMTIQAAGVTIAISPSMAGTPLVLHGLYTYFQKETHTFMGGTPRLPVNCVTFGDEDSAHMQMLMAIPGIGEMAARDLLREFGSPWKVLHASREELKRVKRIGDKTIDRMYTALGKEDGQQAQPSAGRTQKK